MCIYLLSNHKQGKTAIFGVTINKVQWVDFKLENALVSLHSLKTMGLGSIIFKEWRVTWTFSQLKIHPLYFINFINY
jgi:hypothetical protein